MKKNKTVPPDKQTALWLNKARDDELTVTSILKHKDGAPATTCFLAHQSAEKYLKAYLVSKDQPYIKTHNLPKLLEDAVKHDPKLMAIKDEVVFLNEFYIPARYPADYPDFTWKDAENALAAVLKIKEAIIKQPSKFPWVNY